MREGEERARREGEGKNVLILAEDLEHGDDITWRGQNRPKYEKILGTPVPDFDCTFFFSFPSVLI
jgi:hypothetical protein